jgi:hypothetical protein
LKSKLLEAWFVSGTVRKGDRSDDDSGNSDDDDDDDDNSNHK